MCFWSIKKKLGGRYSDFSCAQDWGSVKNKYKITADAFPFSFQQKMTSESQNKNEGWL